MGAAARRWSLRAQSFIVNADPVAQTAFAVSQFADPTTGSYCAADDGQDATGCIITAIRAAEAAGGGLVTFDPGTWWINAAGTWSAGDNYSNRTGGAPGGCVTLKETCGVSYYGILVPVGVSLRGGGASGANMTTLERGTQWLSAKGTNTLADFVLQGNNTVSGFNFQDDNVFTASSGGGPILQLGLLWYFATLYSTNDPLTVSNVVITDNSFVNAYDAIQNGDLPSDHIYITYNTFGGAWSTGILISSDPSEARNLPDSAFAVFPYRPFELDTSVIANNTFYPSSFQQTAATYSGGGSMATNVSAMRRSDFSDNVADGTSTRYLQNASDTPGWRAAYFWSNSTDGEMSLVSNNSASCTGDKYGDGEFIAYDGSASLGGMPTAEPVIGSTAWTDSQGVNGSSVIVQGSIATQLSTSAGVVDISSNAALSAYYQGFWLQVVQGLGKGQWRKVESAALSGNTVTLNVTPAFDVPPDASSAVVVGHAYWQIVTVGNVVDQRSPCTRANPEQIGGTLTWYASTADSIMEDNEQYDTSGIYVHHVYQAAQAATTVVPGAFVIQAANEIRNNLVNGDYAWGVSTGIGGIFLGYGATSYYCSNSACPAPAPPSTGFGVSIAGNIVDQADAMDGDGSTHPPIGAIALGANWETGPVDATGKSNYPLGDTTLVFHNAVENVSETESGANPNIARVGIGIDVSQGSTTHPAVSWRTVLYANTCS